MTVKGRSERCRDRFRAGPAMLVAIMHAAALHLVLTRSFDRPDPRVDTPRMIVISTERIPPDPPEPRASALRPAPPARSPRNLAADPIEVVAPAVLIAVPRIPLIAPPAPALGNEARAGASTVAGTGVGAGGEGDAFGGGGAGDGGGTEARRIRGAIDDSDYPRAARRAGVEGITEGVFTVGIDGRVRGCAVTRSSGSTLLDETACRLIERRYRYEPATDSRGRPVPEEREWEQRWWLDGDPEG